MRFRFARFPTLVAAAAIVASGLLMGSAHAGGKERGQPIEFALPKSDEITTNLNQLTSKKDSLKQLEEDLYKPLETFAPKSSLDGVAAPLPRAPSAPAVPSKRVKEMLERRKNWVFMTPEDLMATPTLEDSLKAPQYGRDGQEKKELPPLERYYQRLNGKRDEADKLLPDRAESLFGTPSKSKLREEDAARDDSTLPSGLRESAEALRKVFEPGASDSPFAPAVKSRSLTDAFGLGNDTPSKEQVQAHKKFMDDYKSFVDPTWHPPVVGTPANGFLIALPEAASSAAPAVGLPSIKSLAPHTGLEAQMDVLSPRLGPVGLPDVNAEAVGQIRSAPVFPTVEPPRVAPPAPVFMAPKRAF